MNEKILPITVSDIKIAELEQLNKRLHEQLRQNAHTFNVTIGILKEQRETAHDVIVQQKVLITQLRESNSELNNQLTENNEILSALNNRISELESKIIPN